MRIQDLDEGVGRIVKGVNTTPDVGVNQTSKEAAKFGFKVDKDGRPPIITKKSKNNTNTLFNLGLTEGIKLRLERDKHIDVLHIMDTTDKQRIEVRGKKGYETNYDPKDKLHQVLDRVGKAANISELMNGEVVSINPNHPQGTRAIRTAQDVLQTENKRSAMEQAIIEGGHDLNDLDKPTPTIAELVKKHNVPTKHILTQLELGIKAEYEHTSNFEVAKEIALDHIAEDPYYYDHLKFVENFAEGKDIPYQDLIAQAIDNKQMTFVNPNTGEEESVMNPKHAGDKQKELEFKYAHAYPMTKQERLAIRPWVNIPGDKNLMRLPVTQMTMQQAVDWDMLGHPDMPQATIDAARKRYPNDGRVTNPTTYKLRSENESIEENFADGKKKGKSRPGRVKRSGASCNGSVTSLRKRAKKASGEKAKMLHWCANMKSGRKKK